MVKDVYLTSKPRYEILDGLRGVAAVLVVAYHLFETYYGGSTDQPINHGYLAVDFFFVLSGFVIGLAYAALKLYDLPVREWLKKKLFASTSNPAQ